MRPGLLLGTRGTVVHAVCAGQCDEHPWVRIVRPVHPWTVRVRQRDDVVRSVRRRLSVGARGVVVHELPRRHVRPCQRQRCAVPELHRRSVQPLHQLVQGASHPSYPLACRMPCSRATGIYVQRSAAQLWVLSLRARVCCAALRVTIIALTVTQTGRGPCICSASPVDLVAFPTALLQPVLSGKQGRHDRARVVCY
jgi:hypothetical protein